MDVVIVWPQQGMSAVYGVLPISQAALASAAELDRVICLEMDFLRQEILEWNPTADLSVGYIDRVVPDELMPWDKVAQVTRVIGSYLR